MHNHTPILLSLSEWEGDLSLLRPFLEQGRYAQQAEGTHGTGTKGLYKSDTQ
ncbi:hypothetical protein D3C72_2569460 [compost metagenome]